MQLFLQGASWSSAIRLAAEAFIKFETPTLSAKKLQDKVEKSQSPKDLLSKSQNQKKFLADKGVDADGLSYNECTSIIMMVWTEPAYDCCSGAWQVKSYPSGWQDYTAYCFSLPTFEHDYRMQQRMIRSVALQEGKLQGEQAGNR